ncbi:hypothetical protein ABIF72_003984 [Bradyrhizobium japonicum]
MKAPISILNIAASLLLAVSTIAWAGIVVLMFKPVFDLYLRGEGRLSAVLFLLIVPSIMAAASSVLPLVLIRRAMPLRAFVLAITSLVAWVLFALYLAVRMAI